MKNTIYRLRQKFCGLFRKQNFSPLARISFAFIFLLMTDSAFAVGGVDPAFNAGVTNFNTQSVETIAVQTDGRILIGANEGFLAGTNPAQSIVRNWTLTSSGITRADITFQYSDADVPNGANESNFKFIRRAAAINAEFAPSSFDTSTTTFNLNNVIEFSDWTLGNNLAPTAAGVILDGRARTKGGRDVHRAQISLTDPAGITRYALTDQFGFYRFTDVPASATYIFNIRHKRYDFLQPTFPLFVSEKRNDLNFTAQPRKGGLN